MSSILTNNSAMVALETLRGINRNLSMVQNEIATGKKISSAQDNSAIWAVATTMESDIGGFKQITDSLNLGTSTVGVARSAAEQVTDRLQDMKDLIVSAQEENVDRDKFQTQIEDLRNQVSSIVTSAQFNGLNLIDGTSSAAVEVIASLDRDSAGNVSVSTINVDRVDLSLSGTVTAAAVGSGTNTDQTIIANGAAASGTSAAVADGATQNITIASVASGNGYTIELDDSGAGEANELGVQSFTFVASASDSAADVSEQLFNDLETALNGTNYSVSNANGVLSITNNSGTNVDITATATTGGTPETATGGLSGLAALDVTTDASGALSAIDGLIDTAIDAAASFGSSQTRISTQIEFVTTIIDSLTSGVGALVDADMEAASAKLQALQVQQQLGTQALSIANQAPQNLLSLFQ